MAFLVALTSASTACGSAVEPAIPRATVTVQRDTVVATRMTGGSVTWLRFTVPAAVHNTSSVALTFVYCASVVETRTGGDWDAVWSPICALGSTTTVEIAPGETRDITVEVTAAVAGPGGPVWNSAAISGTYRLAVGLVPPGLDGRITRIPSNSFTLVETSP